MAECYCCKCKIRISPQWQHHLIPREFGGERSSQIPLCYPCHDQVEEKTYELFQFGLQPSEQELRLYIKSEFPTTEQLEKRRRQQQGVQVNQNIVNKVFSLKQQGVKVKQIAEFLNISRPTVYQIFKTRIKTERSVKGSPKTTSSTPPPKNAKTPFRPSLLASKDIPTLPCKLRKYVKKCKRFYFVGFAGDVQLYSADGLEVRYAPTRQLEEYDKLCRPEWHKHVYGGLR